MTIIDNKGIINVKAFLKSIDDEKTLATTIITYKQLMQGVLKDRKEVTISELVSLTSSIKYRIESLLEGYKYYSKSTN
ncbi:MAG: hypothetical protein DLM72_08690 [Candidatus Nitrosopolaris wilkensis]|nr:MAG: hypothetical protein DLM72_08690 [Candidatus Nitrosopolaris wilkensis]